MTIETTTVAKFTHIPRIPTMVDGTVTRVDGPPAEYDVTLTVISNCFSASYIFKTFDGESVYTIHTSTGHMLNWLIVYQEPDGPMTAINGEDFNRDIDVLKKQWKLLLPTGLKDQSDDLLKLVGLIE